MQTMCKGLFVISFLNIMMNICAFYVCGSVVTDFFRFSSYHIFGNSLPRLFCCLLHQALHSQTLNVHVCHGSISSSSAGISKRMPRVSPVLVRHNLHRVLLDVFPKHLCRALETCVDSLIRYEASPRSIYEISHGSLLLVPPCGGDHPTERLLCLGCQVASHGLGELAHSVSNIPTHFHRGCGGGFSSGYTTLRQGSYLCIFFSFGEFLLAFIRHILYQLPSFLSSYFNTLGEILSTFHYSRAYSSQPLVRRQQGLRFHCCVF